MSVFCEKHQWGLVFCRYCDLEALATNELLERTARVERLKVELLTAPQTLDNLVLRATLEPTLEKALSWIAVWECDRAVSQARKNTTWETCFELLFKRVLESHPHPLLKKEEPNVE